MNELKIYYYKDYESNLGFINAIYYKDKCLAHFKEDTMTIDLSVLNPFIMKKADLYTINRKTNEVKHKETIIQRLERTENNELILHMDNIDEEQ